MLGSTIVLRDGRGIAVHRLAEGRGRTVVLCHAAPGSGGFDPDPEQTLLRGITLIAVDRPGYGGSSPRLFETWSTVASAADDIAEVLGLLGIARVGVAGWSAGGRVALALAARRPDLVDRVAVIATPAPDEEVSWIPPPQRAMLDALRGLPPDEVHHRLADQLSASQPADPRAPEALSILGRTDADDPVLAGPGVRGRLGDMLAGAFAQGTIGLAADIAGYTLRPWGFDPGDVTARTLLCYGSADPVAGSRHGSWYQRRLPDARLEMSPASGHLLVMPRWGRVLTHLDPRGHENGEAPVAGGREGPGSPGNGLPG